MTTNAFSFSQRGCDGKPPSELGRDGGSDGVGGARIGVPVPRQTPRRINIDPQIRYARVVQYSATQHLFGPLFMPKLQHDK
jgi:hypothetical protein